MFLPSDVVNSMDGEFFTNAFWTATYYWGFFMTFHGGMHFFVKVFLMREAEAALNGYERG